MDNSKIIIAVVITIIVVKLVAVHLYLKVKTAKPDNEKHSDEERKN